MYFRVGGRTEGQFICECSDPTCVDKLRLTRDEYTSVRDHRTRFFLVPGHEMEIVDRVVGRNVGFTVVEKPLVP